MGVNLDDVKKLNKLTGAGLTSAKKALVEADGNLDKALEAMRVKGLAKASKKADREVSAGMVHSYLHGGKIGVLVELNCETDFVARTDDFKNLANEIALHIAASSPRYLSPDNVPADVVEKERELSIAELKEQGKPEKMFDKIVEGKMKRFYSEVCLLQQPFVKDTDKTVEELVKEHIAKLGENIQVGGFSRIELGGQKVVG